MYGGAPGNGRNPNNPQRSRAVPPRYDGRANYGRPPDRRRSSDGGRAQNAQRPPRAGSFGQQPQGGCRSAARPGGYPDGYRRDSGRGYYAEYGRAAGGASRAPNDPRSIEAERRRLEYERRRAAEARRRAEYMRRQAEIERRMRLLEKKVKAERRARRKRARKLFYGRALICLCILLILSALTASVTAFRFYRSPDDLTGGKITYEYGGEVVRKCSTSEAFKDGILYLCFSDVADYLDMAVTGDAEGEKFVLRGDGSAVETVEFEAGSRAAYVSGRQMTMSGECFIIDEKVWVPASFAGECLRGVDVSVDGRTVSVARMADEEKSTEKETVYREVSLLLGDNSPLPTLYEDGEEEKVDFVSDLSDYEMFMTPENSDEYLLPVNSSSPLDENYEPDDLTGVVNTRQDGRETQRLRLYAAKSLEALFIEMEASGIDDMSVTSGYRSYESQSALFNGYAAEELEADPTISWEEAERRASLYSSRPGTSEHQSGLCVDMHNLASADQSFAGTEAYKWLTENAWKFGFVLRYPQGKTDITGITFEPWHWRFVGRAAALEIYDSGMCLEEYLAS